MPSHLVISRTTELHRFPLSAIVYVEAQGNYSIVETVDGRREMVSMQLGQVEDMLWGLMSGHRLHFVRLGRFVIINTDFIFHIDVPGQTLVLSDCRGVRKELGASRVALLQLKEFVEEKLDSMQPTKIEEDNGNG